MSTPIEDADARGNPRSALVLLAALTLAALGARLVGVRSMLPHQVEPDAVIYWQAAWFDRPDGYEEMTHWAFPAPYYPFLIAATLAVLPGHSFPHVLPPESPPAEHLAAAAEPFVRARALIAFLSVLAIPAVFFLARRFMGPAGSLIAAGFMATSLLDELYGPQARPHTASASLSLLAMIAILRVTSPIAERNPLRSSALAGLLAGISLGALQNGVFVLPGLLLAHLLPKPRRWLGLPLALAIAGAVFLFAYQHVIRITIDTPRTPGSIEIGGQTLTWEYITGQGFVDIAKHLWNYEPVAVVCALVGFAFLLERLRRGVTPDTRRELVVLASFPLSFAAWWGIQFLVHARFTMPIVPYVMLLAAYGVVRGADSIGAKRAGVAIAVLALPAWLCVKLAWLRARPDTATLAARWLEAHADREKDVVGAGFLNDVPLMQKRSAVEILPEWFQSHWQRYLAHLPPDSAPPAWDLRPLWRQAAWEQDHRLDEEEIRAMIAQDGASFAVVMVPSRPSVKDDPTERTLRGLCGEPVASFLPYDPKELDWFGSGYEQGLHPIGKILHATMWGPPTEIFRVPR